MASQSKYDPSYRRVSRNKEKVTVLLYKVMIRYDKYILLAACRLRPDASVTTVITFSWF